VKRIDTALPGVFLIEPVVHGDARGFFMETWRADRFAELGVAHGFVQDNHSRSTRGVLRGLHYQLGRPQAKLVRVVVGAVFDVAVDVRRGSPTFGRWTGATLSADNRLSIYLPAGFAHGFLTLSNVAEVAYRCSDYYAPEEERGVIWNDPGIGIAWPDARTAPLVSSRDSGHGTLATRALGDLPSWLAPA